MLLHKIRGQEWLILVLREVIVLKWYPYLGGTNNQGIVKFGDSNGNSIDIPSFNAISINQVVVALH